MIRAAELALFLSPIVIFLLWRRAAASGRALPNRTALITMFAGLALLGVVLAWTGLHERHAEGSRYVPAQFQNGQVVPGHDT